MHEPASQPRDDLLWRDLRPLLDAEIFRLPQRYRAAFVLCYLEGKTNKQAAQQLGCPEGTVLSRLAWARQRLRGRLTRKGLTLSATLLTTTVSTGTLTAAVPTTLLNATVRAGLGIAAGKMTAGIVSAPVATLTEGVLRAMTMSKLKLIALALTVLGVLTWGVGLFGRMMHAEGLQPATVQAVALPVEAPVNQDAVSVKTLPPVVVRTVPQSGDTQVDARSVKEIRVAFSKDMEDESWSWSQLSADSFPTTAGNPHYEKDHRTCVLPVKLQLGKTYAIWLNSEKFGNFKDTSGISAVPYLLVFQTKP
jgi:RNA polymerase sigma-70 factor (ECF subfamily)